MRGDMGTLDDLNAVYVPMLERAAYEPLRPLPLLRGMREACPDAGWEGIEGWYVLAAMGRGEEAAAAAVRGLYPHLQTFVPIERVTVVRGRGGHKRKVVEPRAYIPGYVFVRCRMNADLWQGLRGVEGVLDVLSSYQTGLPLPVGGTIVDDLIVKQLSGFLDAKPVKPAEFRKGEALRIVDGPLAGQSGPFDGLDSKGRVRVLLGIMGSDTPVSVKVSGVERAVEG